MSKRMIIIEMVAMLSISVLGHAQPAQAQGAGAKGLPVWDDPLPAKNAYSAKAKRPAPRRDLSGVWNAEAEGGAQPNGALEHPAVPAGGAKVAGQPDEKNIARPLPYTPAGLKALQANKPTAGVRAVPYGSQNNPVDVCDPAGFPELNLYQFRVVEFAQAPDQVVALYQFYDTWRVIWTDERQFPQDPEPKFLGYSIGKWVDDYTFVVQTIGMDPRSWLDNAGRPHTFNAKVEERYHLVDYDTLELTLTIDDPEYYAQPWQALNKFVLHRLQDGFDMQEVRCSPSAVRDDAKILNNVISR